MGTMQNVEDIYPVTSMQELMLLRLLSDRTSRALKEQVTYTLRGPLDPQRFQAAWQAVVDRHAILRTAFLTEGLKEPMQVVRQEARPEWVVEDWRERPDREEAVKALVLADEQRAFDPAQAPLLRFAIVRLEDERWAFLQSMHHILMDRWSASQVFSEAMALYEGELTGRTVELPAVRAYRDYVEWIRSQDDAEAEAYWRGLLAGFTTPLALPRSPTRLKPAEARMAPERVLDEAETEALRAAARSMRVTLNTLVRGAFGAVLGAAAGRADVVFGVTVSGRPAELDGVEQIVGLFINNLPSRVRVDADADVGDWLRRVQAEDVQARRFEHTPLAFVEDWSDVRGGGPLFEALLVFQSDPVRSAESNGAAAPSLAVVDAKAEMRTAYPLTLAVFPRSQTTLQLNYDSTLFEASTTEALLDALAAVLRALASKSAAKVGDLAPALAPATALAGRDAGAESAPERAAQPPQPAAGKVAALDDNYAPPSTETERAICAVWADVLDLDRVGVQENFFDLGGSSVQAIRTIARLQKEAGIQLGAASLTTQTIAQLAAMHDSGATGGKRKPGFFSKLFQRGNRG